MPPALSHEPNDNIYVRRRLLEYLCQCFRLYMPCNSEKPSHTQYRNTSDRRDFVRLSRHRHDRNVSLGLHLHSDMYFLPSLYHAYQRPPYADNHARPTPLPHPPHTRGLARSRGSILFHRLPSTQSLSPGPPDTYQNALPRGSAEALRALPAPYSRPGTLRAKVVPGCAGGRYYAGECK